MRTSPRLDHLHNSADLFQARNPAQPWYVRLHGKIDSLKNAHLKWRDIPREKLPVERNSELPENRRAPI
jgi:hypothetical protein